MAHPEYQDALLQELGGEVLATHGNLVFAPPRSLPPCFAQDIWFHPQIVKIASIGQAAKILQAEKIVWHPHMVECARRSILIGEKLPLYRDRPLAFPLTRIFPKIGGFSLLDESTLIYATERDKILPNGQYIFEEDRVGPPNRAYLKLWEAFAFLGKYPKAGSHALDLGASPGGWTYVLQSLGAEVMAIDKAPLDPRISALPRVTAVQRSAFSVEPREFDYLDYLVCDVACYPERLYDFLLPWIHSGKVGQFICTLKLQGQIDFELLRKFQAFPHARLLHLFNNKHELTWLFPFIPTFL